MIPSFRVYSIGYRSSRPLKMAWAAVLIAKAEDGRVIRKEISGALLDKTKNQADLIALAKALQCIKPEYRGKAAVTIYPPPGYAASMTVRNPDGTWWSNPKQNVEEVRAVRSMLGQYTTAVVEKIPNSSPEFGRCLELVQAVEAPNDRME